MCRPCRQPCSSWGGVWGQLMFFCHPHFCSMKQMLRKMICNDDFSCNFSKNICQLQLQRLDFHSKQGKLLPMSKCLFLHSFWHMLTWHKLCTKQHWVKNCGCKSFSCNIGFMLDGWPSSAMTMFVLRGREGNSQLFLWSHFFSVFGVNWWGEFKPTCFVVHSGIMFIPWLICPIMH